MQKTLLIGNLGQDPETRYSASGAAITNISVATSEKWTDKNTGEKVEKTEWHRVVFFNRLAEVAGEYLKKGSKVYIEGKLQTRKWEDSDGNDRWTTEIVAQQMEMLNRVDGGSAPAANENQGFRDKPKESAPQADFEDDDIPF